MNEPSGWALALATNAAFKGLLGSLGESGHVCARTEGVKVELDTDLGADAVRSQIAYACREFLESGDVVVLADKVIALSEGRVGPPEILSDPDPKTVGQTQREQLATHWSEVCGFAVDDLHLLLADEYEASDGSRRSVLGTEDHNTAAYAVAREIAQITGQQVDVVISDTDTGLDVLRPLIGTVTIGATPLGATSGVTLYEAMRCACAAEFTRGHGRRIPIVICKPAQRCRARPHIGEFRGYSGALSANREPTLTYG